MSEQPVGEHAPTPSGVISLRTRGHAALNLVLVCLAIACPVAVLLAVVLRVCVPHDTGYSIYATTEAASVVLSNKLGETIELPDTVIPVRHGLLVHRPTLHLAQGVELRLWRMREGHLRISLKVPRDRPEGIQLVDKDGNDIALKADEALDIDLDGGNKDAPQQTTVTIPFQGDIRIGQNLSEFVGGILLSGRVVIVERPFFRRDHLVIADAPLDAADAPSWTGVKPGTSPAGVVHVGADKALQVVAHAQAEGVTVQRAGGRSYEISPTWWDQVAHDPYLSVTLSIWAFISSVLFVYELYPKVVVLHPLRRSKR